MVQNLLRVLPVESFTKECYQHRGTHCNDLPRNQFNNYYSRLLMMCVERNVPGHTKQSKTFTLPKLAYIQFYYFIIGAFVIQPLFLSIANDFLPFRLHDVTAACRPGVGNGAVRRPQRKLRPLLRYEYVPKMSELTLGASGSANGRIERGTQRFRDELYANWNPDIIFEDKEQNNEDRYMTEVRISSS